MLQSQLVMLLSSLRFRNFSASNPSNRRVLMIPLSWAYSHTATYLNLADEMMHLDEGVFRPSGCTLHEK